MSKRIGVNGKRAKGTSIKDALASLDKSTNIRNSHAGSGCKLTAKKKKEFGFIDGINKEAGSTAANSLAGGALGLGAGWLGDKLLGTNYLKYLGAAAGGTYGYSREGSGTSGTGSASPDPSLTISPEKRKQMEAYNQASESAAKLKSMGITYDPYNNGAKLIDYWADGKEGVPYGETAAGQYQNAMGNAMTAQTAYIFRDQLGNVIKAPFKYGAKGTKAMLEAAAKRPGAVGEAARKALEAGSKLTMYGGGAVHGTSEAVKETGKQVFEKLAPKAKREVIRALYSKALGPGAKYSAGLAGKAAKGIARKAGGPMAVAFGLADAGGTAIHNQEALTHAQNMAKNLVASGAMTEQQAESMLYDIARQTPSLGAYDWGVEDANDRKAMLAQKLSVQLDEALKDPNTKRISMDPGSATWDWVTGADERGTTNSDLGLSLEIPRNPDGSVNEDQLNANYNQLMNKIYNDKKVDNILKTRTQSAANRALGLPAMNLMPAWAGFTAASGGVKNVGEFGDDIYTALRLGDSSIIADRANDRADAYTAATMNRLKNYSGASHLLANFDSTISNPITAVQATINANNKLRAQQFENLRDAIKIQEQGKQVADAYTPHLLAGNLAPEDVGIDLKKKFPDWYKRVNFSNSQVYPGGKIEMLKEILDQSPEEQALLISGRQDSAPPAEALADIRAMYNAELRKASIGLTKGRTPPEMVTDDLKRQQPNWFDMVDFSTSKAYTGGKRELAKEIAALAGPERVKAITGKLPEELTAADRIRYSRINREIIDLAKDPTPAEEKALSGLPKDVHDEIRHRRGRR